ncbi:unnamed protein product [Lota lota]
MWKCQWRAVLKERSWRRKRLELGVMGVPEMDESRSEQDQWGLPSYRGSSLFTPKSVICASLNAYVKLGFLPPFEQNLPHNNLCYISGWGRTSNESHLATH